MSDVWLCTHCWEQGPEPQVKLLDGDRYGSQRCSSLVCKREKRIFKKETPRATAPDTGHRTAPDQG